MREPGTVPPRSILVVDDDRLLLRSLARLLGRLGYDVHTAGSTAAALDVLRRRPVDAVLTDVAMPDGSGLDLLRQLKDEDAGLPVLVMSGEGSIQNALQAVKLGAFDFLEKPVPAERLELSLATALRLGRLQTDLEQAAAAGPGRRMLGDSPTMVGLRDLVRRVGPSEGRLLILGENGTGKELVAEAVHRCSARAANPFVKLNCSAVPENLVESELFGHRKGAFTGALENRRGRFELAHTGTLFLDEVGDMPLAMQAKLLRVLEEGEIEPVGAEVPKQVDVRVIAATNQDLDAMIAAGSFREDLFYRLAVVTLTVPPLRKRREDIPALIEGFQKELAARGQPQPELDPACLDLLQAHDWPGNVRELRNAVERLAILFGGRRVRSEDVLESLGQGRRREGPSGDDELFRLGATHRELMAAAEARILRAALAAHGGNKSAAARGLGLERSHFHKKLKQREAGDGDSESP